MAIENIRLSEQAREQLIRLKRWTGIRNWNVLCRWGFCVSLSEPTKPPVVKLPPDSNVEMTWRTFGGPNHEIYAALLKQRCEQDCIRLTDKNVAQQFRLHLHRGIAYLAADRQLRSIADLTAQALTAPTIS